MDGAGGRADHLTPNPADGADAAAVGALVGLLRFHRLPADPAQVAHALRGGEPHRPRTTSFAIFATAG